MNRGRYTIDEFNSLVCGKSALIIPHYEKTPKVPKQVINKITDKVFAGEVDSPKKFYLCKKTEIVPLYFSDIRIGESSKDEDYIDKSRFTYIDSDTPSFHSVFSAIRDNKTFLTKDKMEDMFDILNGQARASTGINVLIGKRSSGKTYTLNHISELYSNECLYIEQFEITKECDDDSFKKNIMNSDKRIVRNYVDKLNELFDLLDKIDNDDINHSFPLRLPFASCSSLPPRQERQLS